MPQAVEHPPNKHEALSSNSSTAPKKKKISGNSLETIKWKEISQYKRFNSF
jgi:hypothetical protein